MTGQEKKFSRRNILKGAGGLAAGGSLLGLGSAHARMRGEPRLPPGKVMKDKIDAYRGPLPNRPGAQPNDGYSVRRAADVFRRKLDAARRYLTTQPPPQETNGDEERYADYRASFTKTLPHDSRGRVDPAAYDSLLRAMRSGRPADFERIQLDNTVRTRKLANPQGAFVLPMSGGDGHAARIKPPPSFTSDEMAAEMLELYWKSLLRDVPFTRLESDPLMRRALTDINSFPHIVGKPKRGLHTAQTLFRGETPGDLVGPYISQFLWYDVPYGSYTMPQRYPIAAQDTNFVTESAEWLAVQRGAVPRSGVRGPERFISTPRDLGAFVHADFPYQTYLNAALILLGMGPDVVAAGNPTNRQTTEGGFVSFGGPDILDLVALTARASLCGAWYQKWLVHRRLRPENYGGRLQFQAAGMDDYDLPRLLLETEALGRTRRQYGNVFLPQSYAEGAPTHPSYPAGHACIAGACTTMLKAWFREDKVLSRPVVADETGHTLLPYSGTLTIGGELNKLASNISLGRDWAGVHYRSDGIDGMEMGEAMAIDILRDRSVLYNEQFDGFTLTTFAGQTIRIQNGRVSGGRAGY
ncbi:vanadium-dependent haloperoxidase [Parvularcula sp. LCG005]|uniref:vanadium-dependent haloperoxidase n=1 Tax=Parvularcula sp. LCG005 TaxID=3078805 RepID=UPI0029424B1F|nr:vanadium-dependent haloperoxidase [Parvularcula sp. LCG005]WOI53410.1 vanadium-dependent haloperoxidase [Parvularcula sp. LCG005]